MELSKNKSANNLPTENIHVAVRCRPYDSSNSNQGNTSQENIFDQSAKPIVDGLFSGFHGTIFAYGQTGSGKTFTMDGDETIVNKKTMFSDPSLWPHAGIMARSIKYIFEKIQELKKTEPNQSIYLRLSFLEVYNNKIRDLLTEEDEDLEIRQVENQVFVENLSTFSIDSLDQVIPLLKSGRKRRTVAETGMNSVSSRSHGIVSLTLDVQKQVEVESSADSSTGSQPQNEDSTLKSTCSTSATLHLVDLAGSEKQEKAKTTGVRAQEGNQINWSLVALGKVIKVLSSNSNKQHVPYRDSKLTRLLQNALGGNAKTLMIATISPAKDHLEESLNTLRYANRAKSIQNKPQVNEDPKDAMVRRLQDEIELLKNKLIVSSTSSTASDQNNAQTSSDISKSSDSLQSSKKQDELVKIHTHMLESLQKRVMAQQHLLKEARGRMILERKKLKDTLKTTNTKLLFQQKRSDSLKKTVKDLHLQLESGAKLLENAHSQSLRIVELEKENTQLKTDNSRLSHLLIELGNNSDSSQQLHDLSKQFKLYKTIVDHFIPSQESSFIKQVLIWDESMEKWIVPNPEKTGSSILVSNSPGKHKQMSDDTNMNLRKLESRQHLSSIYSR